MNIMKNVINSILITCYQYFWVSLLFTVLVMIIYLYVYEKNESGRGLKEALKVWGKNFKKSMNFRLLFLLILYTALIGFRTILNRKLFTYPLQDIFGGWKLFDLNAENNLGVTTNGAENILLFIPFSFFLLWFLHTRPNCQKTGKLFLIGIRSSFLFSLTIECSQLLLCLGTFQLADLVYNTLGGLIGGTLYIIAEKIVHLFKKQ